MREIFLDTNIIIDYLTSREPFSKMALRLFSLAENNKIRLNISAISFTTVYYVLRKTNSHEMVIKNLMLLSGLCNIIAVNRNILEQALKSNFKDFEDAVQYYSALHNKNCKIIISRNIKDFQLSELEVMLPEEFFRINGLL